MKNFIDFIIKTLIFIIIFLAIVFFATIFYSYMCDNDNLSIGNAISYVQSIGNNIIDEFKPTNKHVINIALDDTTISSSQTSLSYNEYDKNTYYYNQLDNNAKKIYDSLKDNINNLKKENFTIDFEKQFNDLLHDPSGQESLNTSFQSALDAFFYDYPELFYIDLTKISLLIKSTSIGPLTTYTVKIAPDNTNNYLHKEFNSEEKVNNAISKVENIKNHIINNLPNSNDYDKLLTIHDTLVKSLEYDSSLNKSNTHNIYGALIEKSVVCEGYAKSFKYILDSLNIENILVSGTATNSSGDSESHMWNYIKLNDNWYAVDVTWDDPIIIGGFSKDNLRHDYFLKGNTTFNTSHIPSGKISDNGITFTLPNLSTTNYKK